MIKVKDLNLEPGGMNRVDAAQLRAAQRAASPPVFEAQVLAGALRFPPFGKGFLLRVSPQMTDALEEERKARGLKTRSETIRVLLAETLSGWSYK